MGQLLYILPEGEPVWGMTLLAGEICLLRWKERDVATFRLQRRITVPNAWWFSDMTSCEHKGYVYIGDVGGGCVHRLDVQGAVTQWAVNDRPCSLSVNAAQYVLVTCRWVRKIKEFSSHGHPLRELTLPDDVIRPRHAIQTRSGQFIVCHGDGGDPVHRVCMINVDGRRIVHSHGGQPGSDTDQYDVPSRLAVDDNESVFVADRFNRRVTLLSPTLEYVRQFVSPDQLKGAPWRLYLDRRHRLLYVAGNEFDEGEWRGYAAVFSV